MKTANYDAKSNFHIQLHVHFLRDSNLWEVYWNSSVIKFLPHPVACSLAKLCRKHKSCYCMRPLGPTCTPN